MNNLSEKSPRIQRAFSIIHDAQGKSLSPKDREQKAIELAAELLEEARLIQTREEKAMQAQLARMMKDPMGKVFTMYMTDQCFRSHRSSRIANQLIFLLRKLGIPKYLSWFKRFQLRMFEWFGKVFSFLFIPMAILSLRRETSSVILPGEARALSAHMHKRRAEGVRLNLNHLGEAILGEEEANRRLQVYLEDLKKEDVEYVSIKISTIYSQINLLGWDHTMQILKDRLKQLYRAAMANTFTRADGKKTAKFVNLDMEEYRDLHLTKELFKQTLSEPEFHNFEAGIVLQAYLPDAHGIQKELTEWAMERRRQGGAAIKIRIVKGANLAMEQFEASLRHWRQAPYTRKADVDANYKRMVTYACEKEHANAVHIGIGSHNLFDIAYAMILRAEKGTEKEITFEMLEGMADHIRRVVQRIAGDILLYCPVATKEDFQSAVAYLIRRLDENTGPENFLRHTFGLVPGTLEWEHQSSLFIESCENMDKVSITSRRDQNRLQHPTPPKEGAPFENEADTDFALEANRTWAHSIIKEWQHKTYPTVPLVIAGQSISETPHKGSGVDPSRPGKSLYQYALAEWEHIDRALQTAKDAEKKWQATPVKERCHLLALAGQKMRERRFDLIGVMIADGGKTILESDPEVSEAIDFADYYLHSRAKMEECRDVIWHPKGTILITPPWNFPVSIPAGGILAALVAGNCVLFKPAPEAVLTGWILVNCLWDAGIPKEVLQFVNCVDDPVGSRLIADRRLDEVILTGATSTAKLFKKLNPRLNLSAETGGKNAMIITGMSDRDLAIKDLVHSAFGHSGQKCSAASLAILEAEVYDDPHFLQHLKDAVESLKVSSAWDPFAKVIPLSRPPEGALLRALTTLDEGEEWLVKPKCHPENPHLWSPGVKLGVKEGSFMHQTELFGPVLGIMRAKNLEHALVLANGTPYGLTSGIQSLDEREQRYWIENIVAGNCYINRTITGAIVRRQPFGGCKASSFGAGAKAGGPNYVAQFCHPKQVDLPPEQDPLTLELNELTQLIHKWHFNKEEIGLWHASLASYAHWVKRFAEDHDPSKIVGQDNLFRYRPFNGIVLRIDAHTPPLDVLRSLAAASAVGCHLEVSYPKEKNDTFFDARWKKIMPNLRFTMETEEDFLKRVRRGDFARIRCLTPPNEALYQAAAIHATALLQNPVLANGRWELLYYLREISLSIDYHRYGNLGLREQEKRSPIL